MKYDALIILVIVIFNISSAMAEARFSVNVQLYGKTISLSDLSLITHGGSRGYYFTIRASVTNRAEENAVVMVDDDCTYASWRITGNPFEMLVGSCRNNVYEQISLAPGESYDSILKVWFPDDTDVDEMSFKVGFIEIVDYKIVSGPYWSDTISVEIENK